MSQNPQRERNPKRQYIHASQIIPAMRGGQQSGEPTRHTIRYVKSNGLKTEFKRCRFIEYEKASGSMRIATTGGVRNIRLWAIIEFDEMEVYL